MKLFVITPLFIFGTVLGLSHIIEDIRVKPCLEANPSWTADTCAFYVNSGIDYPDQEAIAEQIRRAVDEWNERN